MTVVPKRTALNRVPSNGSVDKVNKKRKSINNGISQPSGLVLARSVGKCIVPPNMVLVKQKVNAEKDAQNHAKIEVKTNGFRFSLPWSSFSTLIYIQPFSKDYGMLSLDTKDFSEIRLCPTVRMQIIDVDKFYYAFCGDMYSKVLDMDDEKLKMLYDEIRQVIERIVNSSFFEEVKKFKLTSTFNIKPIEKKVVNRFGKTKIVLKDIPCIQYNQGNMDPQLFQDVCKYLAEIRNRFGIYVESVGFKDPNKPEIIVEQERKERVADSDNKMKIAAAETRKKESELNLDVARNEAAGIKVKEEAKYGGRLDAHLDRGFTVDQTIAAMYAENGRTINVGGNAVPFINIGDGNQPDDDLGNNQHVKKL